MWLPDVYEGAPTAVTLIIGGAPQLAAFAICIRLLVEGMLPLAIDWQQMLALMAIGSLLVGNLAAIAQTNLKRMLAFSTISQMGFLLVGFYAKLGVLQALISSGQTSYLVLAVFAVMMSLIGAFYYLRVIKVMYFDAPHANNAQPIDAPADAKIVLAINGALILILGIVPGGLVTLCVQSISSIVNSLGV